MSEEKFEAVIFDVDGLIVDSEALYCETFSETLDDYGAAMSREDYTVCVGHPVADNCVYAVDRYKLDTKPEAFNKVWMGRFEVAISEPERVVLMPGFMSLLEDFRKYLKHQGATVDWQFVQCGAEIDHLTLDRHVLP